MAELIEFPAADVAWGGLPQSGDRYRAYGCWADFEPPTIAFVFPDWSITTLAYSTLRRHQFKPLGDAWDCDGECEIVLTFGDLRHATDVVITGHHLYRLVADLGDYRVNWIWELPGGRAAPAEGSPLVRSIEFRERSIPA